MAKEQHNTTEDEIARVFLKKVSELYNKPIDDLTPVWETIKSGKKPIVKKVVEICSQKLSSGKNKGQPCGKKLKDGVCNIHPQKTIEDSVPEIVEEEKSCVPEIVEEEEEVLAPTKCMVVLSAGTRKGETCGKNNKKGATKCAKHC